MIADVSRSPVLLRRYGASPAIEQGCAFAIFARCPGTVLLGAAGSLLPEGAHKIAGGAVPHGAALCAPATKSLPPPTPHGRGCRTSRPRPGCGVGVVAR